MTSSKVNTTICLLCAQSRVTGECQCSYNARPSIFTDGAQAKATSPDLLDDFSEPSPLPQPASTTDESQVRLIEMSSSLPPPDLNEPSSDLTATSTHHSTVNASSTGSPAGAADTQLLATRQSFTSPLESTWTSLGWRVLEVIERHTSQRPAVPRTQNEDGTYDLRLLTLPAEILDRIWWYSIPELVLWLCPCHNSSPRHQCSSVRHFSSEGSLCDSITDIAPTPVFGLTKSIREIALAIARSELSLSPQGVQLRKKLWVCSPNCLQQILDRCDERAIRNIDEVYMFTDHVRLQPGFPTVSNLWNSDIAQDAMADRHFAFKAVLQSRFHLNFLSAEEVWQPWSANNVTPTELRALIDHSRPGGVGLQQVHSGWDTPECYDWLYRQVVTRATLRNRCNVIRL